MDPLLNILTYVSLISGGILVLLLLMSIVGGLDFDLDIGDTEADVGGLGFFKSALAFFAVSAFVGKLVIRSSDNIWMAAGAALFAGLIAVLFLAFLVKLLMGQEKFVEWDIEMSIGKQGKVYLKIPEDGVGIVHVTIDGSRREVKAKSNGKLEIPTGTDIYVMDVQDGMLLVSELN